MISIIKYAQKHPAAPLVGYWHPVLFCPEPATGERITIGIALRQESGDAKFRWLQSFERLRRVFGPDSATHLPFLIRHAIELVSKAGATDTAHLHFGDLRELYSRDVDASLDELFKRFVPLARDFDVPAKPHSAVQNRRLREDVYRRLKLNQNPYAAALIPQNPKLRSAANPPRYLDVPLQGNKRFATLVSAHAKKVDTIDKNIYPAVAELNAAAKIHKIKNVAVFLLRPNEDDFTEQEYDIIDEHVHQTMFVLKNEGVTIIPEISTELIAASVAEWGLAM